MRITTRLLIVLCIALLAGCQADAAEHGTPTGTGDPRNTIAEVADRARDSMAMAVVPALVAASEELASTLPAPPLATSLPTWAVSPAAVDMIVQFEIVSPAYYTKRLQRPVWPGGASGVTWGVGYDGGHQTRQRIATDWRAHQQVERLATTAGTIGQAARQALPAYRDIVTPLPLAQAVFAEATLPTYHALAERTFRDGWDCLPPDAQGSLVATVQNRGASMRGDTRREMRVLRDACVPSCDIDCMATQYRSMKRVWIGTELEAGLGRRYEATARLAEGARA